MSTNRKDFLKQNAPSIHSVMQLLQPFSLLDATRTYTLALMRHFQDIYILNDEEAQRLSEQLATDITNKDFADIRIAGLSFQDVIQKAHLAYEAIKPFNQTDPITLEAILPENRVVTSDGYQFDIYALSQWLNVNTYQMNNPLTDVLFCAKDQETITGFAAAKKCPIKPRTTENPVNRNDPAAAFIDFIQLHGPGGAIFAAQTGHVRLMKKLLREGLDPNLHYRSSSLLLFAAYHGHANIVKVLLKHHANPEIADNTGMTPLLIATHHGHHKVIDTLLAHGVNINVQRKDGATALIEAASGDDIELVNKLLAHGAAPNLATFNNASPLIGLAPNGSAALDDAPPTHPEPGRETPHCITPLYMAAQHGNLLIVNALLAKEANPNQALSDGMTPLYIAATKGYTPVVETLLKHGACIDNPVSFGITPLFIAAAENRTAVVEVLLAKGADSTIVVLNGSTALLMAATRGHINIIKALVHHGDNVNQAAPSGVTPLYMAAQFGHLDVVRHLIKNRAQLKPYVSSVEKLRLFAQEEGGEIIEKMEALIQQKQHVNPDEKMIATYPQDIATLMGHHRVVDALKNRLIHAIKSRDESLALFILEQSDNHGFTPHRAEDMDELDYACALGMPTLVEVLIKNGAPLKNENGKKRQALDYTVSDEKTVSAILRSESIDPSTCLMAVREGQVCVQNLLIANGADYAWLIRFFASLNDVRLNKLLALPTISLHINTPGMPSGKSALHQAAEKGHTDACERLLANGANINMINSEGNTPMMSAALAKKPELVLLLAKQGADVSVKNKSGKNIFKLLEITDLPTCTNLLSQTLVQRESVSYPDSHSPAGMRAGKF